MGSRQVHCVIFNSIQQCYDDIVRIELGTKPHMSHIGMIIRLLFQVIFTLGIHANYLKNQ
jgi:hypothetical protein